MAFRTVDDEIRANEMRGRKATESDKNPSIIDVVEDTVDAFAKPLANERPSEEDLEERREENDAEQR
jgi:hypothetical protein